MATDPAWYYLDGAGQRQGPYRPEDLQALAGQGTVQAETPVWREGLADWIPAVQVAGLLAPVRSPLPDRHLKPRRGSFLFPRIVSGVLGFFVTCVIVVVLVKVGMPLLIGLLLLLPDLPLKFWAAATAWRKERYDLLDTTVVARRGGIMSDQTTELEIRNITHVKLQLPWLRHKLFGIGNVVIESAGNAQPVRLRFLSDPQGVYAEMRERMQRNGYDLGQQELLHEERPALIGAVGDCIPIALVMFIFLGAGLGIGIAALIEFADEIASWESRWILYLAGPFVGLLAVLVLVLHFLEVRRRTYRVYNDMVVYEEGFLTRENTFIPYENIADSATKRSFLDQVFGLFDVVVSCQGSASEIQFHSLRRGVELSQCIDRLVAAAGRKTTPDKTTQGTPTDSAPEAPVAAAATPTQRPEPDLAAMGTGEVWAADLRMSPRRVLIPLLFLVPLVPIWIVAMIQAAIRITSTRYAIRPESLRHSYRFLNTHDREFATDKITGLVVKANLWDRLLGTVTLRFWSIGSAQSLEFAHVLRAELDLESLMRQIGIPPASPQPAELEASMGPVAWLWTHLPLLVTVLLAAVGLVVAAILIDGLFLWLLFVPLVVVLVAYESARICFSRQRLRFHAHHVEAEQGWMTRYNYFARYRNVKKRLTTCYPGGTVGSLRIFVAGEQKIAQAGQQAEGRGGFTRPCSFTLGFLADAAGTGRLLDDILCGRVAPGPHATPAEPLELICEAPRAAGNSLCHLIATSIIIVPLIVFLPFTIPVTLMQMKRWRYRVDTGRVTASWGILYRREASIVLDRIDSLQQNQDPLNKMFKNGNVSIMTAGSSRPDLVLADAPDYASLYEEIRKLSQGT